MAREIFFFYIPVVYVVLAVIYLWYRYIPVLFIRRKNFVAQKRPCSVIVPVYNEPEENLRQCLDRLLRCDGEKQIIIVNDGSSLPETDKCLKEYEAKFRDEITLIVNEKNLGKRGSLVRGFAAARHDIIVTIDSDTLIEKDSLLTLTESFDDSEIGAATGEIGIENKDENFLTSIVTARYWLAFNFERYSLSNLGIVTCCSGPLSAYRRSILREIGDDFEKESFLGQVCTFGDDRYLTRRILEAGYRVVYCPEAKAKTYTPAGLWEFIKQQLRWKKSFIRESVLILPYCLKNNLLLSFEVLYSLLLPVLGVFARLVLIVYLTLNPFAIIYWFLLIFVTSSLRGLLMIDRGASELYLKNFFYALLHEILIIWLFPVALVSLRRNEWGTRGLGDQVISDKQARESYLAGSTLEA